MSLPKNEELEARIEALENRVNPINYGLGGQCQRINGDLDTCCGTKTGFYMGADLTHAPISTGTFTWFYVIHIVHNELFMRQLAFHFNNNIIYSRTKINGTWSNWIQIQ